MKCYIKVYVKTHFQDLNGLFGWSNNNLFYFIFKDKNTDITVKDNTDDFCLRDTLSIASTDSFVSTAEVRISSDCVFED